MKNTSVAMIKAFLRNIEINFEKYGFLGIHEDLKQWINEERISVIYSARDYDESEISYRFHQSEIEDFSPNFPAFSIWLGEILDKEIISIMMGAKEVKHMQKEKAIHKLFKYQ